MAMDSLHSHHAPGLPPPINSGADTAQEALVRALRASFNILRVLMIVLVVLYLLSGVFRVEPGQQGLVARLGQLRQNYTDKGPTDVFTQGWYWALPDPFDRKYVVTGQVQELPVITFMFNHKDAATAKDLSKIVMPSNDLTPGVDGAMLTGDRNLSHGRWEVQYQIDRADLFVQNVGESPEVFKPLLQRLAETAVVREVAGRTIEQVTRKALDSVRDGVKIRLQRALDELKTGVRVVQVVAYTIEPGAVRQAFIDVTNAEAERLSAKEKAEEAANETLSKAAGDKYTQLLDLIAAYGEVQSRDETGQFNKSLTAIDTALDEAQRDGAGEVAVRLSEAIAQADQVNESLRREFEEFNKYQQQRAARPRITELALWVRMRQEILGNKQNEIFFIPAGAQDIEVHVKSDPQRRIELEEERTLKRQRGEQK